VLPLFSATPEMLPLAWCTLLYLAGMKNGLPGAESFPVPSVLTLLKKKNIQKISLVGQKSALL
jgi:hypothetical protein